jgi:PAS domain S-box-containing protein
LLQEVAERTWAESERARAVRQAQEEVLRREAYQRNSEILESITDAFYAVDAEWRLTYINRRCEEWWHRRREELLGTVLWDMFPNYQETAGYREHLRAATERILVHWETFSPNLHTWVDVSAYPTSDGGLAVYFRDATEGKRAEAEREQLLAERTAAEQRFRALVEALAQTVWTTDAEGHVVEDSPSWRAFTGQTLEQWLDCGWLDVVHPDDREHAGRQWREAIATNRPVDTQFRLWHAASSTWHMTHVRAVPLRAQDGSIYGWVGMNTDLM